MQVDNIFEIITIKKVNYINSSELYEKAPIYCKGSRTSRVLINNKDIDEDNYIFAKQSKNTIGKWIKTDGSSPKFDKVFFKEDFVNKIKEIRKLITKRNSEDEEEEDEDDEIQEVPPIIDLEDNEKFKDSDGNVLEIETVGVKREPNKVYFKVEDVSREFNMLNIQNNMSKQHTSYKKT